MFCGRMFETDWVESFELIVKEAGSYRFKRTDS